MRTYHGWIFVEKSTGFKDHFSVQYRDPNGKSVTRKFGYGDEGAVAAVEFFESNIGPILLESTPLGLRVYTVQKEEGEQ